MNPPSTPRTDSDAPATGWESGSRDAVELQPLPSRHQPRTISHPRSQNSAPAPAVNADFRQQAVHVAAPSHSVAQLGPLRTGQSCTGSPVIWCSAWKSASDSRLRT
jgi:hypothetical protein